MISLLLVRIMSLIINNDVFCNYLTDDVDYYSGPYNVTVLKGITTGLLSVTLIDDNLLEGIEEFNLTIELSSLPGGIFPGNHIETLVVIVDNDGNHYFVLIILML